MRKASNSKPFFSICIPAYNRAYILEETLQSILSQTFQEWEVIIVDDGSKDNTKEVVAKLIEQDNRIRYIYQDNAERSAARNKGADNSNGTYLLFLDSDDAFKPEHLQKLYDLFEKQDFPVAMAFSNVTYLLDSGFETPEIPEMPENGAFEYLLLQPITPSRVCIHKDIFKRFRFDPKIVIVEDLVLWVCIASEFPVYQLKEPTAIYRIHGGNSIDLSQNSYFSRYKGLQRFFNDPIYKGVSIKIPRSIKKHLLAECSFNMARHFEFAKQFGKMNQMLLLSFRHKPSYRNKERAYLFLSHFPVSAPILKKAASNGSHRGDV
jgi:glycosyltransferase involved in cell wall biosynthesis